MKTRFAILSSITVAAALAGCNDPDKGQQAQNRRLFL